MEEWLFRTTAAAVAMILAITLHEAAHGWMAFRLGDDTAKRLGRVTFNPLRHIDPVGTLVVPMLMFQFTGFLFGWAKPVPVNFGRLRNPRRDMVWVALAGPGTNLLLALASAWAWRYLYGVPSLPALWLSLALGTSVTFNIILMVFNLIPLPPLDGGRVAVGLLPDALAFPLARLERYGMLILIFGLFLLPFVGKKLGYDINPFAWIVVPPVEWLLHQLASMTAVS